LARAADRQTMKGASCNDDSKGCSVH
jgi:hypothetical protein